MLSAVVRNPCTRLLPKMFALLSRDTKVEAVAALATPVPVGNPLMTGVANVGVVPKTNAPEPVAPVTADAKLDEEGVLKNVATPVPIVVTLSAPVPPLVVTRPFVVRFDSVEIF